MDFASAMSTKEQLKKGSCMMVADSKQEATRISLETCQFQYFEYGFFLIGLDQEYPPKELVEEKEESRKAVENMLSSLKNDEG